MKKIIDFFQLIFVSIISGSTAVIPGVSGGTILAVFNLTEELTNSIQSILDNLRYIATVLIIDSSKFLFYYIKILIIKMLKKNEDVGVLKVKIKESSVRLIEVFKIIKLPVIIGLGSLIFSIMFAKIIIELQETVKYFISFLFIGLIIFSLPILWGEANEVSRDKTSDKKYSISKIFYLVLGFCLMLSILILFNDNTQISTGNIVDRINDITFLITFIIGAFFAGMMAIIPGISGTNIMIMFGIYDEYTYISAHLNDFLVLYIIYLVMTILGIIVSSYVLNFIYKKFRMQFFSLMTGLTAATLFTLNPFENYFVFMQIIIGFILAFLLIKFLTNKN